LDYPFLVGSTHYQLFEFISKSKDQEIISALQDKSTEDIKKTSSEVSDLNASINTRTNDISRLQADIEALERYSHFDLTKFSKIISISESLSNSIEKHKELSKNMKVSEKLFFDKKKQKSDLNKVYLAVERDFSYVKELEDLVDVFKKERVITDLIRIKKEKAKGLEEKLTLIEKTKSTYSGLLAVVKETNDLMDQSNDLSQYLYHIKDDIVKKEKDLKEFSVCPFCGQALKNHEVHNE
jgi:hypothetical protein